MPQRNTFRHSGELAEMRNKGSDAHGVGGKRISINDYHARLFVNSAMTMADFILAVSERTVQNENNNNLRVRRISERLAHKCSIYIINSLTIPALSCAVYPHSTELSTSTASLRFR